jgi:rubrerythrin
MRLTELASDLEALRADLAEELLAVNRYEAQTFGLADDEARDVVARILDEKKQHVATLLAQLRRLDPKQAEKLDRR